MNHKEGNVNIENKIIKVSSFGSDVLTIVSGTTLAQILTILVTPILTRLYTPEDFGLLALFLSVTGVIGTIACMRYELSIMLPKHNEEAANLLGLSIVVTFLISVLTAVAIVIAGRPFLILVNSPQLNHYLWLIPIFVFINGIFIALNFWNSRTKHFKRLSIAKINTAITTSGVQLGAGFTGYATGNSLIAANLLGRAVSTITLAFQILRDDLDIFKQNITWKGMLQGMKKHRKFPLLDTWSALFNAISWQLPVFLLSSYFSASVAGFYSLGFHLLQLPMSFIGSAISQVFYQRAAEAKSKGTLHILVEDILELLVKIGIFPVITVTVVGSEIFGVFFGEVWTEAGVYAQILSLWAFLWFISSPLSTLWLILEKQEFGFKITFLNLITRYVSLMIGSFLGRARISLLLFAVSGIFIYGYLCIYLTTSASVKLSSIKSILLNNFTLCILPSLILIGLKLIGVGGILIVLIACLFNVGYYLHFIKTDPRIYKLLRQRKYSE